MKKIFISLMCIISMVCVSACSCARPADVYYQVSAVNEDGTKVTNDYSVLVSVEKKFREPSDTACYKKVDDSYVLIENASEISFCYDQEGNKFEKATLSSVSKTNLVEPKYVLTDYLTSENDKVVYKSSDFEVPKNSKHSLVFTITVKNEDTWHDNGLELQKEKFYIKAISKEKILNGLIKDKSLNKIKVSVPNSDKTIDGENYYYLTPGDSITFVVEVKGVTTKDLELSKSGEFKLSFDLVFKAA